MFQATFHKGRSETFSLGLRAQPWVCVFSYLGSTQSVSRLHHYFRKNPQRNKPHIPIFSDLALISFYPHQFHFPVKKFILKLDAGAKRGCCLAVCFSHTAWILPRGRAAWGRGAEERRECGGNRGGLSRAPGSQLSRLLHAAL